MCPADVALYPADVTTEIDRRGWMWIIDVGRVHIMEDSAEKKEGPPKLWIWDLEGLAGKQLITECCLRSNPRRMPLFPSNPSRKRLSLCSLPGEGTSFQMTWQATAQAS